ncbi:hypothetical protein BDF14DRAFT_1754086 [Spinellus fusiger]|nr:hypothetical protein BDF14DRAFT_1754086 [Spinellus fusiger]
MHSTHSVFIPRLLNNNTTRAQETTSSHQKYIMLRDTCNNKNCRKFMEIHNKQNHEIIRSNIEKSNKIKLLGTELLELQRKNYRLRNENNYLKMIDSQPKKVMEGCYEEHLTPPDPKEAIKTAETAEEVKSVIEPLCKEKKTKTLPKDTQKGKEKTMEFVDLIRREKREIDKTKESMTTAFVCKSKRPRESYKADAKEKQAESKHRNQRVKLQKCYVLPSIKAKLRRGDYFTFGDNI